MIYFDTDVLTNASIEQNPLKYIESNDLIEQAINQNRFCISWLNIQELGFVLAKLGEPHDSIASSLDQLSSSLPLIYNVNSFQRAIELAGIIGFKNFNDCLHTAIAEQHCTDLYTYNKKDFEEIKQHSSLNIHIL